MSENLIHKKPLVILMNNEKEYILPPGSQILGGMSIRCRMCNSRLPRGKEQMVKNTTGAPYTFRNKVHRVLSPGSELFIPFTIPVTFSKGLHVSCSACRGPRSVPIEFVASSDPTFEGFFVNNLFGNRIIILLIGILLYMILR